MDDDSLQALIQSYGKVHGLIFLFKWQGNSSADSDDNEQRTPLVDGDAPDDLFFARQVTTNACATQAILSILMNANETGQEEGDEGDDDAKLILGDTLSNLKSFVSSFPADLKGESIGASEEIRTVHNSFARKEAFLMDDSKKRVAGANDDVFHFIAYVPHTDGTVYELDGLQAGPIPVGKYTECDATDEGDLPWLAVARKAIQQRIEKYQSTEIKFNLMALTRDKRVDIQSKIKSMKAAGLAEDDENIGQLNMDLMQEEELRRQWKDENERRRHNYVPFCMELIRALAKSGNMQDCVKKANEKARQMKRY